MAATKTSTSDKTAEGQKKGATTETRKRFTAEERAAMQERARELKASSKKGDG